MKQTFIKSSSSKKFSELQIYHQNIRGIHNKLEFLSRWESEIPEVLCFMEHHLSMAEITDFINHYILGAYFCHKLRKNVV
jgi:hypothetical protein